MILVVDDEPYTAQVVAQALPGTTIQMASTIREGLKLAATMEPTIVVLDVCFPHTRKTGVDALPDFDEACRDTPVVVATSHYDDDLAEEAIRAGCHSFVEKWDPRKLAPILLDAIAYGQEIKAGGPAAVKRERERRLRQAGRLQRQVSAVLASFPARTSAPSPALVLPRPGLRRVP